MAIVFPINPVIGQELSGGGFTWIWSGSAWEKVAASSGGGSGNGFYLNVGSSGNTTYTFDDPQPPGVYFLSSKLGDTTYDIYLSSESASPAGYTNSEILVATDSFNKVVVYGATPNDVLILESKTTVNTNTSGDVDGGVAPYLTSITPSELESFDDTATLSGGNLATDVEIYFTGINSVDLLAKSIVRNSAQELIITRPDNLLPDFAPYDVRAINPGVPLSSAFPEQHILFDAITAGTYPQWISTSPIFWEQGVTTAITLVAQDIEQSDVDYQIVSGSLWAGFVLNEETGVITGDDSALQTSDSMTFTVRATDSSGLVVSDKEFVVYLNSVPISSLSFDPFVDASNGTFDALLFGNYSVSSSPIK